METSKAEPMNESEIEALASAIAKPLILDLQERIAQAIRQHLEKDKPRVKPSKTNNDEYGALGEE